MLIGLILKGSNFCTTLAQLQVFWPGYQMSILSANTLVGHPLLIETYNISPAFLMPIF